MQLFLNLQIWLTLLIDTCFLRGSFLNRLSSNLRLVPNWRIFAEVFGPIKKHPQNIEDFLFSFFKTTFKKKQLYFQKHEFGKYHAIFSKKCKFFYQISFTMQDTFNLSPTLHVLSNYLQIIAKQRVVVIGDQWKMAKWLQKGMYFQAIFPWLLIPSHHFPLIEQKSFFKSSLELFSELDYLF